MTSLKLVKMVKIQVLLLMCALCVNLSIEVIQTMDYKSDGVHVLLCVQWALSNINQVWLIQILFNQMVEWIAMRNLINY